MRANFIERRLSLNENSLITAGQIKLDSVLTHFQEEASNVENIAAMTLGSAAFSFFRAGSLGMIGRNALPGLNALSYAGALGTEVIAFRGSHSLFQRMQGKTPHEAVFDKQGLLRTFTDFLALKGAGGLAQGRNIFLGHTLQSSAMVASRHLNAHFGFLPAPEGGLVEQFAEAEASTLALGAGKSLFGTLTGNRTLLWERSLDLQSEIYRASQSTFRIPESAQLLSMSSERKGILRRVRETVERVGSASTAISPLISLVLKDISTQLENGNGQNARAKLIALKLLLRNFTFATEELQREISRLEEKTSETLRSSAPRPLSESEAETLLATMQALLTDPRTFIHGSSAVAHTILGLLEYYRTELQRATEKANIDRLTGLYNRNHLDESIPKLERSLTEIAMKIIESRLEEEFRAIENTEGANLDELFAIKRASMTSDYVRDPSIRDWCLMIDIDHFKQVNDTYGHANGDMALRHVADIIHENIRNIRAGGGDVAFRYGGEEMFIYVRETHEAGIRIIAERIKRQLAAQAVTYLDPEGNVIAQKTITVTIGAARICLLYTSEAETVC